MTGGALPVGAGDMDGLECILRVPDKVAELDGIDQVCPVSGRPDAAVQGKFAKKISERLHVIHSDGKDKIPGSSGIGYRAPNLGIGPGRGFFTLLLV